MGIDIHVRGRELPTGPREVAGTATKHALVAAGGSAAASFAFHRFGPPGLSLHGATRATAGTAIALGLATGVISAMNGSGVLHGGERSNSMLESTVAGAATLGAIGWHPLFHGRTVSNAAGARFNVLLGVLAAPVIHQLTAPD